ncbi:MAG: RNA polymerase sporulation sigma factor SigG [Clostridia bacterium]|nr:RNA polymerase sporulation sigma factor SigG [Clostridia bacterium]
MLNKVEISGLNTSRLPVLSQTEKTELLKRIKEGDSEAKEKFINGNLRLVLSVIKRFTNRGENPDDLFQIGCIGLIKAINNFDMSLNVQFSTYAVPMIIGELKRYLRDNAQIRVSRSLRDTAYKALKAKTDYTNKHQKEPTTDELAKMLEIPKEELVYALEAIQDPVSLYEPAYNDGTDTIFVMDQVSDTKNTDEAWIEDIALSEALKKLGEREKHIITMRFFAGRTQMEVAEEIGISQAQVSRLEKSALLSMRKHIK